MDISAYQHLRNGGVGFHEQQRGLSAVWGNEAVQFLDGLITNDMKTLEDGKQMLAAFPNAQGRLLAVVRVLRQGDRFLIETEEATREKIFQNLFRFTYAGDFFVEELSEQYRYIEIWGDLPVPPPPAGIAFSGHSATGYFIPTDAADDLIDSLSANNAVEITDELYENLRIESGIPKYGVDMDETTIVPELGLDGLISYTKGCYIGQEIIARIHFRGHVAKQLTGLILNEGFHLAADKGEEPAAQSMELTAPDGKAAGRITSNTYSPKLDRQIALAFVRHEHLAEGTELKCGDAGVTVAKLPFVI